MLVITDVWMLVSVINIPCIHIQAGQSKWEAFSLEAFGVYILSGGHAMCYIYSATYPVCDEPVQVHWLDED